MFFNLGDKVLHHLDNIRAKSHWRLLRILIGILLSYYIVDMLFINPACGCMKSIYIHKKSVCRYKILFSDVQAIRDDFEFDGVRIF